MKRQIKTLPVAEAWDCAGCGNCCRGSIIPLSDEDLQKLESQDWAQHPELRGTPTVVGTDKHSRLAQKKDGSCVFLMEDNRCRIHAEHGADAKPTVCRLFPLQVIPHEKNAILTLRRSCPSAAADEGRALEEHREAAHGLVRPQGVLEREVHTPPLTSRFPGGWPEFRAVTDVLARLLADERYPLVRRLAHAVLFCRLLDECDLGQLSKAKLNELLNATESLAYEFAGDEFRDRQPVRTAHAALFRQVAVEYLRLHSAHRVSDSWGARWRLVPIAFRIARGRGTAPRVVEGLPDVTFNDLEEPLGPLPMEVQEPLIRFYQTNVASLQYTLASRRQWTVCESFQALALAYPVALWLLRWLSHGREPSRDDAIQLVTMLDRGQGLAALCGAQHRRRVKLLNASNAITQLLAWYAR